jgi:Flp pilus assembly protein TadD
MSSFFVKSRWIPKLAGMLFLLSFLAGCGSKLQNAIEVQSTLSEASRHAQVDPDDKQARQWADRAIALAPNNPITYFGDPTVTTPNPEIGVAFVFQAVGDDTALVDYMRQAVQKFPNDDRGYQILIDADGRLGRTAERQVIAAKLIPLLTQKLRTPGTTGIEELTVALAQAYFDSGDPVNGAATYQKAIQAYPTSPTPLNNLAYAYAVSNTHLAEALPLAQQAVTLAQKQSANADMDNIEVAGYQDTLGWVQYRQGNYKEAEQNLLEAASAVPRLPEVRYHLGTVYAAEGKTDAARAEFGHAVLLSPGYVDAQQALDKLPKS